MMTRICESRQGAGSLRAGCGLGLREEVVVGDAVFNEGESIRLFACGLGLGLFFFLCLIQLSTSCVDAVFVRFSMLLLSLKSLLFVCFIVLFLLLKILLLVCFTILLVSHNNVLFVCFSILLLLLKNLLFVCFIRSLSSSRYFSASRHDRIWFKYVLCHPHDISQQVGMIESGSSSPLVQSSIGFLWLRPHVCCYTGTTQSATF